jgi:beta-N-acetylhexosaminidase
MAAKDSFRPVRDRLRHPTRRVIAVLALAGLALGVVVAVALSGGGGGNGDGKAASPPPADRPVASRSFLEQVIPVRGAALPGAAVPTQIAATVRAMSEQDKVAQLMLLGYKGSGSTGPVLARLRRRPLGGIVIRSSNYTSDDQLTAIAGRATNAARHAHGYPPLIWAPQEGGDFSAIPSAGPADPPGSIGSARRAAHHAAASGRSLASLNLNGVLAPVIDVGTEDATDPLGPRAYSHEPSAVAAFGVAAVVGYKRAGVMSAVEHFPGLGAATQSPDNGPTSVGLSLDQLRKRDLVPFAAAIGAGVPAVVISNASYATDDFVTPGTLSKAVSTDLLRGEMRFRGVAVADDLSQPAITTSMSVADAAVQAIAAGCDMVYISGPKRGQEAAYRALLQAVRRGAISHARLDEAVTRILTMKREYGLVRGLRPQTKVSSVAPGVTTPVAPTPVAPPTTTPVQPSTQTGGAPAP